VHAALPCVRASVRAEGNEHERTRDSHGVEGAISTTQQEACLYCVFNKAVCLPAWRSSESLTMMYPYLHRMGHKRGEQLG
jgi:hypothetical protein